jgi:hypothetical protein
VPLLIDYSSQNGAKVSHLSTSSHSSFSFNPRQCQRFVSASNGASTDAAQHVLIKSLLQYSRVRNRLQFGKLNEFYFSTHILCALTLYGYPSPDLHSLKSCSGCHVGFCLELADVGRGASIESMNDEYLLA